MDKECCKNKPAKIVIAIVILLAVAGGSFYGGMAYGKSQSRSGGANFAGGPGGANGARRNSANAGGLVNGSILSQDANSLTVQLRAGGSKIIFFSPTTEIGKFVSGTLSDLTVGSNIMATGKTNADGSITAQSIQLRPAGSVGGFGGQGGAAPAGQPKQ